MKKTFLKSRKYKLSNDMQHFHVHLDLPYHSNESPTVLILFSGNSMMIRNGPIFDSATIGWDKTKLRMRLTKFCLLLNSMTLRN